MAEDVKVPSKKEISQLPRLVQVAFAARCARRVQPLFTFFWPEAPQKHTDAVEKAILITERFAAGDKFAVGDDNLLLQSFHQRFHFVVPLFLFGPGCPQRKRILFPF